jgi:hypothetical protein
MRVHWTDSVIVGILSGESRMKIEGGLGFTGKAHKFM